MNPIVIVGGGLSGLASGVELTSRGIPVILLEQKSTLGGRAYSFVDTKTGETIDNGQHVLIAGYRRTMKFLERIGTSNLLSVQQQPSLVFYHPSRGFREFRLPRLPSPFHLFWGIITCTLFSAEDRLRVLRAGLSIQRSGNNQLSILSPLTVHQWLEKTGQSEETRRSFWEPLTVSIMNEHIETASAFLFLRSLRKAFLGSWKDAALAIPAVGLTELYVNAAGHFIEQHGGQILRNAEVLQVISGKNLAASVRLRDASELSCSACILAVPSNRVFGLLPEELRQGGFLAQLETLPVSPIVSIHLWFKNNFISQDFFSIVGRRVQWVFNKRAPGTERVRFSNVEPWYAGRLSAVISAAYEYVRLSNEELVRITLEDLRSVYGDKVEEPSHAVVIREKRATFSSTPAVEPLRPHQKTPLPNLFLGGDWTYTGYPATIEGAVLSGQRCADLAERWWRMHES